MEHSVKTPRQNGQQWVYTSLRVRDGEREIKPAAVAFDRLRFTEPPCLTSSEVEIIIVNGDEEDRYTAVVLPHEAEATRIPIRIVSADDADLRR